jgi:oxygen-dependent protoporphyrinogen oxidase
VPAPPVFTHVLTWPRAIAQYTLGHAGRVATVEGRGEPMGLHLVGGALRGVGVNDVIKDAKTVAARIT